VLKNLLQNKRFHLLVIGLGLILMGILVYLIAQSFSQIYTTQTQIEAPVRQVESGPAKFAIKKITIKAKDDCYLEILPNGYVQRVCNDQLYDRILISTDRILELFSNLDETKFKDLALQYFSEYLDLVIIIDTNQGTKTIVINSSGGQSLPDYFQTIVDTIEDLDEELNQPSVSPPPQVPTPTPIPPSPSPPVSSPTPIPSSSAPTPTTRTYNPGEPQDSFDCSAITETNVTVSNTRCLP